ncbi:hypothetical protein BLOT_007342 [Blomia tropicalis]|nr:hypothetical protein BLOT_007342 [Blomia tropicalis]
MQLKCAKLGAVADPTLDKKIPPPPLLLKSSSLSLSLSLLNNKTTDPVRTDSNQVMSSTGSMRVQYSYEPLHMPIVRQVIERSHLKAP